MSQDTADKRHIRDGGHRRNGRVQGRRTSDTTRAQTLARAEIDSVRQMHEDMYEDMHERTLSRSPSYNQYESWLRGRRQTVQTPAFNVKQAKTPREHIHTCVIGTTDPRTTAPQPWRTPNNLSKIAQSKQIVLSTLHHSTRLDYHHGCLLLVYLWHGRMAGHPSTSADRLVSLQ